VRFNRVLVPALLQVVVAGVEQDVVEVEHGVAFLVCTLQTNARVAHKCSFQIRGAGHVSGTSELKSLEVNDLRAGDTTALPAPSRQLLHTDVARTATNEHAAFLITVLHALAMKIQANE